MSDFREIDGEMYLIKRLKDHGNHVFDGVTTSELRKARMRRAIEEVGADVIVGRAKSRRPLTYREAFAQLYGEPL